MSDGLKDKIKKIIESGLPGQVAQYKMAPSIRNIEALLKKIKPVKRESAVLILIYPDGPIHKTVLIKRPSYDGPHSGQVSFPGGKFEEHDADLIATALREASEETGISPQDVEILGRLTPLFIPVSNSQVLPVVGYIPYLPYFSPDPGEVDYLIETDVFRLLEPDAAKTETIQVEDRVIDAPYFDIHGHHVWGATAMMLGEFREVLRQTVK